MNEIRKERMRALYIDIVCNLIRDSGMSAVTIRNISQKAGYNSATLYSYFDSLTDLILCAQMRFEEDVLTIFQQEVEEKNITDYYNIWPHMYGLMAKYYLDHPNIFDCEYVADIGGTSKSDLRNRRNKESKFQQYIMEKLIRISQETGKELGVLLKISLLCISQVTGMVLLHTKERVGMPLPFNIDEFEQEIELIIHSFME